METLLSHELENFRVHVKSFAPHYRCRWSARVPGRLCVFLHGSMLEAGARYERADMVYKPPEDRPRLSFGDGGARTLTVELRSSGIEVLRSSGFRVDQPFAVHAPDCHTVAERARAELALGDEMTSLALEGLVLDLFARSHRARRRGGPPAWLEHVRERIDAEYARPKTLRDYARAASVHPVHLAQSFRAYYRASVGEHIRALRVRRAMRELAETQKPIADIAIDAGFADQSHLNRVFKRHTGRTPRQYRAVR